MTSTSKPPVLGTAHRPVTLDPAPRVQPDLYQPKPKPHIDSEVDPEGRTARTAAHRTAVHGNYLNYYERRVTTDPTQLDDRLELIPREWIENQSVLDVGCNAGQVSIQLARDLHASRVTAVDLDPGLIRKARRNLELAWSTHSPNRQFLEEAENLSLRTRSTLRTRTEHDDSNDSYHYFPISLGMMFGYLPRPKQLLATTSPAQEPPRSRRKSTTTTPTTNVFPENLTFICQDWVEPATTPTDSNHPETTYDVIVAFSITKWIHLHRLNPGLLTFFKKCFNSLNPGGRLVLEPQPFSTYQRSIQRSTRDNHKDDNNDDDNDEQVLKKNYEQLKAGNFSRVHGTHGFNVS
ncbi:class I SAM-dependent methyltransferase [Sporobolomyces koalae]|uniref:class I SAM-dependent methyltransferase n=1 Tax=Sporobolomyces koalae TaxID=500713 RepID=UPI0031749E60